MVDFIPPTRNRQTPTRVRCRAMAANGDALAQKKTVTFDAATRSGEPQNAAAAELERELASAEAYDDGFAPRSCPTAGRLLRQPASPTLPAGMTVMQGAVDPALVNPNPNPNPSPSPNPNPNPNPNPSPNSSPNPNPNPNPSHNPNPNQVSPVSRHHFLVRRRPAPHAGDAAPRAAAAT